MNAYSVCMGHHQLSSEAGTSDGISKFKDGKQGDKAGGGFDGELDMLDGAALPGKTGELRGSDEAKTAKENRSRRQSKPREDMKGWEGRMDASSILWCCIKGGQNGE